MPMTDGIDQIAEIEFQYNIWSIFGFLRIPTFILLIKQF